MKTSTSRAFEGAALSNVIVLAYKSDTLTFHRDDLPDLLAVLKELGGDVPASEAPTADTTAPVPTLAAAAADAPARTSGEKQKRNPRGLVWAKVRDYLEDSPRSQSFNSILRHLNSLDLDLHDTRHGLKITLGRRVSHGHLEKTPSGRYKLTRLGKKQGPFLRHANG